MDEAMEDDELSLLFILSVVSNKRVYIEQEELS